MDLGDTRTLTLFDLLARNWDAPGAVIDLRFDVAGTTLAVATASGAVALAAVADDEPPEKRLRVSGDLGQTTIRPRSGTPAPMILLSGLADAGPPIAAAGAAGFLVGGGDGHVLRLAPDGGAEPTPVSLEGAIRALDGSPGGGIAAADAASLAHHGAILPRAGVTGLAFAPDGRRLAVARGDGVAILDGHGGATDIALPATGPMRWRADGTWLAVALGRAGLGLADPATGAGTIVGDFPAPVGDLAWSAAAGAVVASGAFRIAAWDGTRLPASDRPLVTGHPGLVLVTAVACHPSRRLVAAGYANGQVVIAEIGGRDELLLRQSGAEVTALAFSPDGRHLAIGDAAGTAAIATFPPQMFK